MQEEPIDHTSYEYDDYHYEDPLVVETTATTSESTSEVIEVSTTESSTM